MSERLERLTVKEAASIIKMAFTKVNKNNKGVFVWSGICGIVLGGLMGAGLLTSLATEQDMNGQTTVHTKCAVINKPVSYFSNGITFFPSYGVETSCGYFSATESVHAALGEGEIYDLTTSAGNWAKKPSILAMELSPKNN